MRNYFPKGVRVLTAVIPEGRKVAGLEYGPHISTAKWAGHFVRIADEWFIARQTPAPENLAGSDAEIIAGIVTELGGRVEYLARDFVEGPDGVPVPQWSRCPRAAYRPGNPVRCILSNGQRITAGGGASHE